MVENQISKTYDLEERTFKFAQKVREFIRKVPRNISNIEDAKQLVRASGSVGANYIEANESLSKKDLAMRIRICRKEAKETRYWLKLLNLGEIQNIKEEQDKLIKESTELMMIFGAILQKLK